MTVNSQTLSIAYSPCPNDTFLFYALMHQKLPELPLQFSIEHQDIQTLNQKASRQEVDLIKISVAHYTQLQKTYQILPVGAALGKGYGPIVLKHPNAPFSIEDWNVGLPGPRTTAHLLWKKSHPHSQKLQFLRFHEVLPALRDHKIDAGIIIHESRFSYDSGDLELYLDLGKWWNQQYQMPLPLGCLCLLRKHSYLAPQVTQILRSSLHYAQQHSAETLDYILSHSQESQPEHVQEHIRLYVNEYTEDLGSLGQQAIQTLLNKCTDLGWNPSI